MLSGFKRVCFALKLNTHNLKFCFCYTEGTKYLLKVIDPLTDLKATGSPYVIVLTFFPIAQTLCILLALRLFCNLFCTSSSLSSPSSNAYLFCHLCVAHVTSFINLLDHHFTCSRLAVLCPTAYSSEDSYSFPKI